MAENGPIDMSKLVAAQPAQEPAPVAQVPTPPPTPNPNKEPGAVSGTINFDQLELSNEAAVEAPKLDTEAEKVSSVNALLQEKVEGPKVDISTIEIQEIGREEVKKGAQTLGESGLGRDMISKLSGFNYRKLVTIAVLVIVASFLTGLIVWGWTWYLKTASQPKIDPSYQTYVDYGRDFEKLWSQYTQLNDYYTMAPTSFLGGDPVSSINAVLNSTRLSYVQKKDIFQNNIPKISADILANYTTLDTLKKDITQYGFFPKELLTIFGEENQDISIKKSLMSLEIVKFSTAIKVFSYLDTFIKGLANLVSLSSEDIQKKMQDVGARGEKDIKVYLDTCYLNPFEIDETCSMVGDFDTYYTYYEKGQTFDTDFFKKLIYYIDLKLEQTDLPSFSIVFQKFDPKQKEISFNVSVNTFKQDEASLIKEGILNPHIFVVTQLLDLLRQSLFVIGENIEAKQLKVTPTVVQIGTVLFPVNTSTLSFILPIQKNPQREIADYILNKDFYFVPPVSTGSTETIITGEVQTQ